MYTLTAVVSVLYGSMRGEALRFPNQTARASMFRTRAMDTHACVDELQGKKADMVRVWNRHMDSSPVVDLSGDGTRCVHQEGSASAGELTFLQEKGEIICAARPIYEDLALLQDAASDGAAADAVVSTAKDPFMIGQFPVPDAMPGGAGERGFIVAWPPVRRCSEQDPCPMVLHLHGLGEHGPNPGELKHWGLLNYYVWDEACRNTLGSVLLLPQLSREENWAALGPPCFEHFVRPLVQRVLEENPNIDRENIAIAGYSGGAVGALLGATMYPDLFTILAAGSAAGPPQVWHDMGRAGIFSTAPVGGAGVRRRLQLAAFAWTEGDHFNTSLSMDLVLGMLEHSGALGDAKVRVRYYGPEVQHMEASEALFNHWPYLHRVLWEGRFTEECS